MWYVDGVAMFDVIDMANDISIPRIFFLFLDVDRGDPYQDFLSPKSWFPATAM